jgi:hypothetical protein
VLLLLGGLLLSSLLLGSFFLGSHDFFSPLERPEILQRLSMMLHPSCSESRRDHKKNQKSFGRV